MDFHRLGDEAFTVDDFHKAHDEDLAVQERFDVFELKYWVDVEAKTLFCLTRAPNKEACNEVHKNSHGNTACNIIEVSDNEVNLFLGEGTSINDLAYTNSGELDTGYRTILMIDMVDLTGKYEHYSNEVNRIIEQNKGVAILQPDDDNMVSFIFASDAILSALAINKLLNSNPDNIEYNLSLVSGKPVDEHGKDLFEETKKKVRYLCSLGLNQSIYIDSDTKALSDKEQRSTKIDFNDSKVIQHNDFVFLLQLFDILNEQLNNQDFKSETLNKLLGLSKSQAYRKIKALTGVAPNQLLQELRLRKSLRSIGQNSKNIAEIAYDLGFSSPTYFTRLFKKRFGTLPTTFAKIN